MLGISRVISSGPSFVSRASILDVNRSVVILLHQLFADQDRVFEVVPAPRHEGHKNVSSQSQLAAICARTVRQHLPLLHAVPRANQRLLADARVLVRPLKLRKQVNVRPHFAAQDAGLVRFHAHDHALGVHLVHDAVASADDDGARIARGHPFHARAYQRRFALDQRHSLALHVRAHQCAVGIVVFKEWNQRRSHRHQLLRRHVDVVHFLARLQHEVTCLPAVHQVGRDAQLLVERRVGLRDHVAVLFPCRKIEAVRLDHNPLTLQLFVSVLNLVFFDDLARFKFAVASVHYLHEVNHSAALHLAIGRFDESEFIDACVAGKRAD
jgi:hypothetical protein